MSVENIIADWKNKSFKPIYWLEGDEPYFIDKVMHYAEHHILTEAESGFNLTVFYGKDAEWATIMNACKRYPMFSEKQVVLLKEAQQMRDIERLEPYIENPLSSTIFVVSFKDKKVDGRGKLAKTLKKNGVLLTTKKLYENQLPEWTEKMIQQHGLTISHKALLMLVDHIGNDLSRIENEVEKLSVNLANRKGITEDDIENYIGISKEFNVFELQDAICRKDFAKCLRIIQYFNSNPKAAPIQLLLPTLYGHFSKIYALFAEGNIGFEKAKQYFYNRTDTTQNALTAMKLYGFSGMEKILLLLHQYNLRSIGIHDGGTEDVDLLKEMLVKMMS